MSELSWNTIRRLAYDRAQGCCEYCQTCESNIGHALHIEHIDPNGDNSLDNLCLSCANCNLSKAKAISAVDSATGRYEPLFNPRTQILYEHFKWVNAGLQVHGLTPTGRASVTRLKMNQDRILISHRSWIAGGYHPAFLT